MKNEEPGASAIAARIPILRCVACHAAPLTYALPVKLQCDTCGQIYPVSRGVACLLDPRQHAADQQRMSAWWDDLCLQWYTAHDKTLTSERLLALIPELLDSYRDEDHLIFRMGLDTLAGAQVLDIGCGGGIHDAIFQAHGGHVSAVDISGERAASSAWKLSLVPVGIGFAAQADGENLPFQDGVFDVIYSNGVMHHSESTEAMVVKPIGS